MAQIQALPLSNSSPDFRKGVLLVAGAAIVWSFGGAIGRFITLEDAWTMVFWRSLFAFLFLLGFMLWRDGIRGTIGLFRAMGLAGLGVGLCFATASSSFVLAMQHTTIANILLIQAAAPLFAALMAWIIFKEKVNAMTWAAIAAVIAGVGIMVSGSFSGTVSPIGDGLALVISICFSIATVITRHAPQVRMTPAVTLATFTAGSAGALFSSGLLAVTAPDYAWLFLFGAVNLGMGLVMFVTGARLVPAALGALVSTLEPAVGPVWVWLIHNEVPGVRTLIGGGIVFAALVIHILADGWRRQRG